MPYSEGMYKNNNVQNNKLANKGGNVLFQAESRAY